MTEHRDVVELLGLARAGDPDAYISLVSAFAGPAWIAAYLDEGDPANADERLHRATLAGWQRRRRLGATVDVAAWLRSLVLEHRVRRWFAPRSCAVWHPGAELPGAASPRETYHALTHSFLWALPGDCREPLLLRYREGMSVCATARLLGEPLGAVRRRLASSLDLVDAGVEQLLRDEGGILGARSRPALARAPQAHERYL